jgi:hypothetical protein
VNLKHGVRQIEPDPRAYGPDSTILAYLMNEVPLTRDHGYPLRAVVGGWFGMAWVKWITHIRVIEQPFFGYWQARDYFRWERSLGEPMLVPLSEMEVKAQIARPVHGAHLIAVQPYRIFGAAWSGEAPIRQVRVSTGDGEGWREARLLETKRPYAWRLWESIWTPERVGRYRLRCRAVDDAARVQPDLQRCDCESYAANWIVPVEVLREHSQCRPSQVGCAEVVDADLADYTLIRCSTRRSTIRRMAAK